MSEPKTATEVETHETDDRVAAIPEFLDWLKKRGVQHPKIGLEVQGANNLCLVTVDDVNVCCLFASVHMYL